MAFNIRKSILVFFSISFLLLLNCGGGGGGNSTPPPVPVITDINGGIAGSGTVGSLFIIDGTGFGNLSAANSGYAVEFRDANTNAVVANAPVDFTAAGNWTDIFIKATVPNGLTSSTTYKVTVTTAGGTSNAVNFLISASVSFSPSTITWSQTSALPVAQQGFPTVIATIGTNSFIYALGGNTASSTNSNGKAANTDTVYMNQMSGPDGTLTNTDWTAVTPLPVKRGFAAAVFANEYNSMAGGNGLIYVIGGLDDTGAATGSVYFASLNTDGTIPASGAPGTWTETAALPQALFAEGAVIFHGRIYVAGGNDSTGTPVKSVYTAKINADGTIETWDTLPDLPVALAYHQLVTAAGYLYVLGGDTSVVDPVSNLQTGSEQGSVYFNQIDLVDGSLVGDTWTTNPAAMGKNRSKHTTVVAGGYVLDSGGVYNGYTNGSSEQQYSQINADGSLGSFNGATGSHTIASAGGINPYNHSAAYFVDAGGNPHVLILGGADANTGAPSSQVWYQH